MRMKDDHMGNGQLKAAYNIQVGTNNQFAIDYGIYQNPGDTTTLPRQIKSIKELYSEVPENLIADAAYGSEENYEYLEGEGITAYVKYNMFDKEEKGKGKKEFSADSLYYNKERDCYYCPMGQKMSYVGNKTRVTDNGYKQTSKIYQAINCNGCPMRGVCHNGKGERRIEVNDKLNTYRKKASALLKSEQGIIYRKKRGQDVEPVFGNIKQNKGFKRFLLRGIEKVATETGLVLLSHNIKKIFTLNLSLV